MQPNKQHPSPLHAQGEGELPAIIADDAPASVKAFRQLREAAAARRDNSGRPPQIASNSPVQPPATPPSETEGETPNNLCDEAPPVKESPDSLTGPTGTYVLTQEGDYPERLRIYQRCFGSKPSIGISVESQWEGKWETCPDMGIGIPPEKVGEVIAALARAASLPAPAGEREGARNQFESWAVNQWRSSVGRYPDEHGAMSGRYLNAAVQMAWEAWQASSAPVQRPSEPSGDAGEGDAHAQQIAGMWKAIGADSAQLRQLCQQRDDLKKQLAARDTAIDKLTRERDEARAQANAIPSECPITRLPFFMWIEHPDNGWLPTYGGPYDSYTIPAHDDDGLYRMRYDHDAGGWEEGTERLREIVVDETDFLTLESALEVFLDAAKSRDVGQAVADLESRNRRRARHSVPQSDAAHRLPAPSPSGQGQGEQTKGAGA